MAKIKEKKLVPKSNGKKSSQSSTPVKNWWKTATEILDASIVIDRSNRSFTEEDEREFADAILQWSKRDMALYLEDFLNAIGLTWFSYYRRVKKSEFLQEIDRLVRERLGSRQRMHAMMGKIDAHMTKSGLSVYLDSWKPSVILEEQWDREDRHRAEDKEHQEKMAKLRLESDKESKEPVLVKVVHD